MIAILCCRGEGRKYEKAKEWGVQVVNSTFIADIIHSKWIECAWLKCCVLFMSTERIR